VTALHCRHPCCALRRCDHGTCSVVCVENVDVAEGSSPAQACQSVLQCLNDVDCLKTYCQATTIRNGWKLESAK